MDGLEKYITSINIDILPRIEIHCINPQIQIQNGKTGDSLLFSSDDISITLNSNENYSKIHATFSINTSQLFVAPSQLLFDGKSDGSIPLLWLPALQSKTNYTMNRGVFKPITYPFHLLLDLWYRKTKNHIILQFV